MEWQEVKQNGTTMAHKTMIGTIDVSINLWSGLSTWFLASKSLGMANITMQTPDTAAAKSKAIEYAEAEMIMRSRQYKDALELLEGEE